MNTITIDFIHDCHCCLSTCYDLSSATRWFNKSSCLSACFPAWWLITNAPLRKIKWNWAQARGCGRNRAKDIWRSILTPNFHRLVVGVSVSMILANGEVEWGCTVGPCWHVPRNIISYSRSHEQNHNSSTCSKALILRSTDPYLLAAVSSG
jgi:hypothetical protein